MKQQTENTMSQNVPTVPQPMRVIMPPWANNVLAFIGAPLSGPDDEDEEEEGDEEEESGGDEDDEDELEDEQDEDEDED